MPSIINNVVPGFMAPLRTGVFLKIDERYLLLKYILCIHNHLYNNRNTNRTSF